MLLLKTFSISSMFYLNNWKYEFEGDKFENNFRYNLGQNRCYVPLPAKLKDTLNINSINIKTVLQETLLIKMWKFFDAPFCS